MFPTRFYPDRMYAARYWPKASGAVASSVGPARFGWSIVTTQRVEARRETSNRVNAERKAADLG